MKDKYGTPQPNMVNSKNFINNYDEINWGEKTVLCASCGLSIKKSLLKISPELFVNNETGVYHKNCTI